MKQQAKKKMQVAIAALGLLAVTFLLSTPAQAQSARGSLRISFIVESRFQLKVDQAARKVAVKAPGTLTTLQSSAPNSLSLDAALAEAGGGSMGEMTPTSKPVAGNSASAVNLLMFAK